MFNVKNIMTTQGVCRFITVAMHEITKLIMFHHFLFIISTFCLLINR